MEQLGVSRLTEVIDLLPSDFEVKHYINDKISLSKYRTKFHISYRPLLAFKRSKTLIGPTILSF